MSLLAQGRANLTVRCPEFLSLGIVEVGTVLGLLGLLFLAFVAVQVRYLFGGAERVVSTAGMTYAEYARLLRARHRDGDSAADAAPGALAPPGR